MLYSGKGRHSGAQMGTRPAKRLPRFACAEFFAGSEPHLCRNHSFSLPPNKSFIRSDTRSGTLYVTDVLSTAQNSR